MKLQDYYETLGVRRGARPEAIKQAYRSLVLRWHPDRHTGAAKERAVIRFKEISEAYEVLADPHRRREHDAVMGRAGLGFDSTGARSRNADVRPGDEDLEFAEGFSDTFSTMYGGFEKGFADVNARGGLRSRGRDLDADCSLTVSQVMAGGKVQFDVPMRVECGACVGEGFVDDPHGNESICPECEGNGSVSEAHGLEIDVPSGAYEGMALRLVGQGMPGKFGGESGDVCVTLRIRSDDTYRVVGQDVHAELPVAPWEALDGARIEVCAPTGVLRVSIPQDARNGARLRVPGHGLPLPAGARGDLFLAIRYDLPTALTSRQKQLIRELGGAGEGTIRGGARAASPGS